MNKFIKVLTTIVITLLLTVVVFVPKSEAAISGENVSELRGVWVSTVSNIDITTQKGTGEKAIKDYQNVLLTILDKVESTGLNAIFFQIRPANDALYESKYNVWSEFLAGYGVNPGWDMLSWFIEKAHERGIELHAWLNPYRVTASSVTNGKTAEEIKQIKLDLRAKTLNNNIGRYIDVYIPISKCQSLFWRSSNKFFNTFLRISSVGIPNARATTLPA